MLLPWAFGPLPVMGFRVGREAYGMSVHDGGQRVSDGISVDGLVAPVVLVRIRV